MTKPYLKPLAVAVSLALSLAACGKSEPATDTTPAKASTAAAPARRPSAVVRAWYLRW